MTVLTIIRLFLSVAESLLGYAKDKQLLSAGEAINASKSLQLANATVAKAIDARRNVKHDADSVRDDPDNRD